MKNLFNYCFWLLICFQFSLSQNVELFQQFNGRYDYTAIGNTMNIVENGPLSQCDILTSSSAELNIDENETIIAAYLYWAGSGEGDFEVTLNDSNIVAERTFSDALDINRVFFAAFADVTELVQEAETTSFTLSDLDLTDVIAPYCPTGTNFAGWAIAIVLENPELPLNQLNIYDGLESVPTELSITLDNLYVLDNENAKIGFIAWEGDSALAVTEQLSINGTVLSNLPLNPADNAFNGTNSFTNSSSLYNMDLDVYNIQNNINIGDSSATISLTSGQDFVMINSIITVLNSQLPDATISIDNSNILCGDRNVVLDYTVYNINSTDVLPANVPIAFYFENELIGQSVTDSPIAIGGELSSSIALLIPGEETQIEIEVMVDDIGDGTGIVTEINENNNTNSRQFELLEIPDTIILENLVGCNEGFEISTYNLLDAISEDLDIPIDAVSFYRSEEEAKLALNQIQDPLEFHNEANPQLIIMRVETIPCYLLYAFSLVVENCPPEIPEGFSPNNDQRNDFFNIKGLYDVFVDHELLIYNRNGTLIFQGDNSTKWNGNSNKGIGGQGNRVAVGTYYYVLNLKDPNYRPMAGWVYVNY